MEVSHLMTHLLEALLLIIVTLDLDWWVMRSEHVKEVAGGVEWFPFVNVSIYDNTLHIIACDSISHILITVLFYV